ncbi:hypothetical protein BACFIN_05764 [Bacteroides finegoldii DSM 17565]|nr:hypothetical protein BACFIN_05764 [Bacteroides finegoldii DSM 17565]
MKRLPMTSGSLQVFFYAFNKSAILKRMYPQKALSLHSETIYCKWKKI